MHILLTDISSCPRCAPTSGLILLVDELVERRIRRGALACPNCRERYPIEGGTGDFTMGTAVDFGPPIDATAAARLVALAGVTSAPARLLIVGPAAAHAAAAAELVPEVEILAAGSDPRVPSEPGLSRIAVTTVLPFLDGRASGVILSGGAADSLLEEGIRVLAPGGRLVLEPSPARARGLLEQAGLKVLASEGDTLVAA